MNTAHMVSFPAKLPNYLQALYTKLRTEPQREGCGTEDLAIDILETSGIVIDDISYDDHPLPDDAQKVFSLQGFSGLWSGTLTIKTKTGPLEYAVTANSPEKIVAEITESDDPADTAFGWAMIIFYIQTHYFVFFNKARNIGR